MTATDSAMVNPASWGPSGTDVRALVIKVLEQGPASTRQIREHVHARHAVVAAAIEQLERHGWITRVSSPDRRGARQMHGRWALTTRAYEGAW